MSQRGDENEYSSNRSYYAPSTTTQQQQQAARLTSTTPAPSQIPLMSPQFQNSYYWDWNAYYYNPYTAYAAYPPNMYPQQYPQQNANDQQKASHVPPPTQFLPPPPMMDPYTMYNMMSMQPYAAAAAAAQQFYQPPQTPRHMEHPSMTPIHFDQSNQQQLLLATTTAQKQSTEQQIQQQHHNELSIKEEEEIDMSNHHQQQQQKLSLNETSNDLMPDMQTRQERLTPLMHQKPHTRVSFGLNCLVQIRANDPCDGQPALVDIHNLNDLFEDYFNTNDEEFRVVRQFPGPLIRDKTPKALIIQYCQKQIKEYHQNRNTDLHSYQLLWEYLSLLIRQNGYFDLKTDISSLLLGENHNWQTYRPFNSQTETTQESVDHQNNNNNNEDDDLVDTFQSQLKINGQQEAEQQQQQQDEIWCKLREYLSNGNKLNAIDYLSKNNEWSHAFFIASTMSTSSSSTSTNNTLMNKLKLKFINSLSHHDPIYTLYQLYIGRIPTLNTINWNEWRIHLSIILSNYDLDNEILIKNCIKKFADTLSTSCRYMAAHFCYLLINTQFGDYKKKSSKIVLVGSSHNQDFAKFCQINSIQATEIYEYATQRQDVIETFLPYKLLYTMRLCEYGLFSEAYKYIEVVAKCFNSNPNLFIDKLSTIYHLANRLRLFDTEIQLNASVDLASNTSTFNTSAINVSDLLANEPDWFVELTNNFRKYYFNIQPPSLTTSGSEPVTETSVSPVNTNEQPQQQSQYNNNYENEYVGESQQNGLNGIVEEVNTFKIPQEIPQQQQYDGYLNGQQNHYIDNTQEIPAIVTATATTTASVPSTPHSVYNNNNNTNTQQFQFNSYQPQTYQQPPPPPQQQQQQQQQPVTNTNVPYNPMQYNQQQQQQQPQPQIQKERSPSINTTRTRRRSRNSDSFSQDYHNSPAKQQQTKIKQEPVDSEDEVKPKKALNSQQMDNKNNKGILSSVFGIFSRQQSGPKSMVLPADKEKKIVWDEKLQKFINKEESSEEAQKTIKPPPIAPIPQQQQPIQSQPAQNITQPTQQTYNDIQNQNQFQPSQQQPLQQSDMIPTMNATNNVYSLKNQNRRTNYYQKLDVLGSTAKKVPSTEVAPLLSNLPPPSQIPSNFFVPAPSYDQETNRSNENYSYYTPPTYEQQVKNQNEDTNVNNSQSQQPQYFNPNEAYQNNYMQQQTNQLNNI